MYGCADCAISLPQDTRAAKPVLEKEVRQHGTSVPPLLPRAPPLTAAACPPPHWQAPEGSRPELTTEATAWLAQAREEVRALQLPQNGLQLGKHDARQACSDLLPSLRHLRWCLRSVPFSRMR
jgi:hypothetical protein